MILLDELAEELLALPVEFPGAVRISRVEQIYPVFDGQVKRLLKLAVHGFAVPPQQLIAPGPRPEPHRRDAQRPDFHLPIDSSCADSSDLDFSG